MSPWRAWRVTLVLAFRAWPAGAIGRIAVVVLSQAARGLVPGLALRRVIEGGGAGWMVLLGAGALVSLAASPLWEYLQRGIIFRLNQAVTQAVMGAALAPAGIEHLESARYADALEAVRTNARAPWLLFDWMASAGGALIGLVASAVVLAGVHPSLVLPVLAAAGLGRLHAATRRRAIAYHDQSIPGQRLARRLVEIGTSPRAAKELRVLGLGPWLVGRHRAVSDEVARRLVEGERGPVFMAAVAGVAQALLLGLGLLWLVRLAATGRASAGDLALGLVLLGAAVDDASTLGSALGSDLVRNTHAAQRYLWLLDYVPAVLSPAEPQPVPPELRHGIELRDVRFAYQDGPPTLEGVSLSLPAGSTVALVGDNGAGKSTLVKLLCRFYDPDTGSVTVDGVDLRALDLDGWRAATSGAFQDFARFKFLAREAVGVGDLAAVENVEAVALAAGAGGAAPFLELLPLGYETQLGRDFPAGADLSEGQWQKVALSRSLMRPTPLLVVLDEPTAALDARAEHDLFERYATRAAEARARGGITLLVSHRFSTVRMADLIVVLDRGRVVEVGSHDELMAISGRYAELYDLQALRYR